MSKWETIEEGIRVRTSSRKYGVGFDKYWSIRATINGKMQTKILGWSSENHINLKIAREKLSILRSGRWEDEINGEDTKPINISNTGDNIPKQDKIEKMNPFQVVGISEELRKSGFFDDIKPVEPISIKELWEYYDHSKRGRKSEKTDYYNYKHIDPFFGCRIVYTLRTSEINTFKSRLYEMGFKDGTVKHILELLRRIINYGILHGKCVTILLWTLIKINFWHYL